jgi:hypothetical protein
MTWKYSILFFFTLCLMGSCTFSVCPGFINIPIPFFFFFFFFLLLYHFLPSFFLFPFYFILPVTSIASILQTQDVLWLLSKPQKNFFRLHKAETRKRLSLSQRIKNRTPIGSLAPNLFWSPNKRWFAIKIMLY